MRNTLWAGLIAGLSILGSIVFACAAPFAAIGALAASGMGRSQGLALVTVAWLANQIIGFAILGYPVSAVSFAWGAAIGLAAILGFLASRTAMQFAGGDYSRSAVTFAASFLGYELTLYVAGALLSASGDAFSIATMVRVFEINLAAFVGLLLLHRILVGVSLFKATAKPVLEAT